MFSVFNEQYLVARGRYDGCSYYYYIIILLWVTLSNLGGLSPRAGLPAVSPKRAQLEVSGVTCAALERVDGRLVRPKADRQ